MPRFPTRILVLALVLMPVWSCGPPPAPPGPGQARGQLPDLRGFSVAVFPIQIQTAVPQGVTPDPELAHALGARGEGVTWVFSPEIEEMLQRSPGVPAQIRGLPVHIFLQSEVNRIGDPLFGHILRVGGLTGADVALIPVELRYGEGGAYTLGVALIGTRTGRVSWYGVVEGDPGEPGNPAAVASVADRMARILLPFG